MLVRDVMRKTVSVHAEETLQVAALRLKQENIGALPVVEADQVAGMITDRDILLRGAAEGRSMRQTKAREVMSVGTVACHDKDDLDHALGLMSRNHIHRLPVLDDDEKLVGVLSLNQFRVPSSEPAAFEVVFYKKIPNSSGHVYNVELTRVAVARCSSKTEAVQAAIKEFEKEHKAARWDVVADGYDVLERGPKLLHTERVRQRAHELWEQEGRPEGRQDEHWARACRELQMEEQDSFLENTGVAEQEKPIPIIPAAKAKAGLSLSRPSLHGRAGCLRHRNHRSWHLRGPHPAHSRPRSAPWQRHPHDTALFPGRKDQRVGRPFRTRPACRPAM